MDFDIKEMAVMSYKGALYLSYKDHKYKRITQKTLDWLKTCLNKNDADLKLFLQQKTVDFDPDIADGKEIDWESVKYFLIKKARFNGFTLAGLCTYIGIDQTRKNILKISKFLSENGYVSRHTAKGAVFSYADQDAVIDAITALTDLGLVRQVVSPNGLIWILTHNGNDVYYKSRTELENWVFANYNAVSAILKSQEEIDF